MLAALGWCLSPAPRNLTSIFVLRAQLSTRVVLPACRSLGVHPGLAGQDHGHPTHCSCTLHPMCLHLGPDAPWSGSGAIPCRTTFLGPLLCSRSPLASPHSKTSQRAESFFGTKGVITPDEGLGEHQPHSGPSKLGESTAEVFLASLSA